MKNSYLSLLAVGAIAAASALSPLVAQTPPAAGQSGKPASIEDRLAKMKEKLALTDDQVAKLKTIFEDQKAKLDPIFADTTLTPEQKREKAKPIVAETRTKIDGVLTPEQKAKLEENRKQKQEKSAQ